MKNTFVTFNHIGRYLNSSSDILYSGLYFVLLSTPLHFYLLSEIPVKGLYLTKKQVDSLLNLCTNNVTLLNDPLPHSLMRTR